MAKIFLSISIMIFFLGCEQLENISVLDTSHKYPTQVGQEWEYNTMWKSEYYDQSGNINIASLENLGNTVVRITKINERLETYNNLILFESFEVNTPQNIQRMWYSNSDTGFFAIAYSNAGASRWVLPKRLHSELDYFIKSIKELSLLPGFPILTDPEIIPTDSIHFYSPPRKVYNYPLQIGSRWVELLTPFYRERFINNVEQISAIAENYLCYKVESVMTFPVPNLILNDYVSSSSGLIMREIIADSVAISSPTNPDTTGFYKSTEISKLVREKK